MANVDRHRFGDEQYIVALEVASATVIERGDLIMLVSNKAEPVSLDAGSTKDDRQANAKAAFVGVAISSSAAGETADVNVMTGGVFEMDIASATLKSGTLVDIADDGSNLEDQIVEPAADNTTAIGVVWENMKAAGTKCFVRLITQTHGAEATTVS